MNNLNPITLLDNLLADYASPKARRLIHSLILLGVLIATAILAFDGDWQAVLLGVGAAAYAALNKANTPSTDLDAAGEDTDPDDGLSYEDAGGQPFPEEDPRLS